MVRLRRFFTSGVFFKCYQRWASWVRRKVRHREKLQLAGRMRASRAVGDALGRLSLYAADRRIKRDKLARATAFAAQSKLAKGRAVALWAEYMVVDGAWWEPGGELEQRVKSKCSKFVGLISGQWLMSCFREWAALLAKKRRAMRRWQNSTLYFGMTSWVDYMHTEGPWWEPEEALSPRPPHPCTTYLPQTLPCRTHLIVPWPQVV
jgi:hypothetical protein